MEEGEKEELQAPPKSAAVPSPSPGEMVGARVLTSPQAAQRPHSRSGSLQGPRAGQPGVAGSAQPWGWGQEICVENATSCALVPCASAGSRVGPLVTFTSPKTTLGTWGGTAQRMETPPLILEAEI